MKKTEKNKLTMYESVKNYMEQKRSLYESFPGFAEAVATLKTTLSGINVAEEKKRFVTAGRFDIKSIARSDAIFAATGIAGAIYAAGKKSGNTELVNKSDVNFRSLDRLRDVELAIVLNSLNDLAQQNSEAIAEFGITQETISSFGNKVDAFINASGGITYAFTEKKNARRELTSQFDKADEVLITIDKLMENFRTNNKEFYFGYKSSRAIRDVRTRLKNLPENTNSSTQ